MICQGVDGGVNAAIYKISTSDSRKELTASLITTQSGWLIYFLFLFLNVCHLVTVVIFWTRIKKYIQIIALRLLHLFYFIFNIYKRIGPARKSVRPINVMFWVYIPRCTHGCYAWMYPTRYSRIPQCNAVVFFRRRRRSRLTAKKNTFNDGVSFRNVNNLFGI